MKKKLIAIVTSLAMVATMVPSVAFANTTPETTSDDSAVTQPAFDKAAAVEALGDYTEADKAATVTYADYDELKQLLDNINGLPDADKTEVTVDNAATNGYTNFKNTYEQAEDYKDLVDAAITAIGNIATSIASDANADTVTDAETAYAALVDETQCKLGMTQAEAVGPANAKKLTDAKAAKAVYTAIKAVTGVDATTIEANADKVKAANDAYAELTAAQKAMVGNAAALDAAVAVYNTYENTAKDNLENFKKAAKAVADLSGVYSEDNDAAVIKAYVEYCKLSSADKAAVQKPQPNNDFDYYAAMMNAIRTQWSARLAKLQKSVDAVAVVKMGANDTRTIAAVKTLGDDIARFNDSSTTDKLWDAIEDPALQADTQYGFAALVTSVNNALTAANAAWGAAKTVEPFVVAIAGLPEVTGDNYQDVIDTINGWINSTDGTYYAIVSDTAVNGLKSKVGNYDILEEKLATAENIKKQITDVAELVIKIDKHLTGGKLTDKEIKAYEDAYNEAAAAYNKLDKGQKKAVDALVAAKPAQSISTAAANIKAYYAGLEAEIAVEKSINDHLNGHDPSKTQEIAEILKAYEALSDDPAGTTGSLAAGFKANISKEHKAILANVKRVLLTEGLKDNGAVDKAAVETAVATVKEYVAAIPATVTLADRAAIAKATNAYKAITTAFSSGILVPEADDATNDLVTAIRNALADEKITLDKANTQITDIITANEAKVRDFISKVARISGKPGTLLAQLDAIDADNRVEGNYYNFTTTARVAYEALTADQKTIVQEGLVDLASKAYEKLGVAEANIAAAKNLEIVASAIKAVPNAATLNVNDADAVAKVEAAQELYEALTEGVQKQLIENNYVTVEQLQNYEKAVKKVNDYRNRIAAAKVIDLIKAMPGLPQTTFAGEGEITPAFDALVAAEKEYNALSKDAQALVTNASILLKYRTDFDRLMQNYATSLYAEVAKMNPDALSDADTKKVAELKVYVDGQYLNTKDIAGFDRALYDRLVAGVDDTYALSKATVGEIATVTYNGKEQTPAVTVTDKAGRTVSANDYDVKYSNNVNAGTAYAIIAAKADSDYTGVVTQQFTIDKANLEKLDVTISGLAKKTYTGKAIGQSLTVKAGDNNLARNKDYTQTYKNNKNVGKATVIIAGNENYTGTITRDFVITPKKGAVKSLKAGKKQLTVKVTAQAGAKYRIVYQTVNKANNGKAKAVNTSSTSKTIKSLKSGKTYKVKVRGYKKVGGKTYYGAYSAWKKAKVK